MLPLGVAGALHVREVQAARGFDALGFEPCEPGPEVRPAPALRFELLGEIFARVLGHVRDSRVDLQDDDPLGVELVGDLAHLGPEAREDFEVAVDASRGVEEAAARARP